ncbi:MAG: PIG-L family deacetylase [Patescibacteria group bacterium]|jgi:LmbE family N-acetylglucosaminyl deacetylase
MKFVLGKKILVFTAHPDDESYAAAGTLYKNFKQGGENYLFCASLGEKGKSHLKKEISELKLKRVRKKELLAAGRILHIKKIVFAGVPDGKIQKYARLLYTKGLKIANKIKPDFILSFGPDGISGHLDHIGIGKIARKIAGKKHIKFVTFAFPPVITGKALKWLASRRKSKHYARKIKYLKPTLKILIDPAIKKKALLKHRSQMEGRRLFTGFPEYAVKELLKSEYFH